METIGDNAKRREMRLRYKNVIANKEIDISNNVRYKRTPRRAYASPSSRILNKYGQCNVLTHNIPDKDYRYIKDFGNTLLNIRWRWILLTIFVINALFYVIYGFLWMLIGVINDVDNPTDTPCITNVKSFTSYLILSIETLSTRGNSDTQPGDCQANWMLMTIQVITQIVLDGAFVTAVFVRMSRGRNKQPLRMFSNKAVICMRDGVLCLIFRVRDIDGRHWTKTTIKAVLIKMRYSSEYYFENLKLETYGLLIWPPDVVHEITSASPLWSLTPIELYRTKFEIMVVLEGESISIGEPSQSQTSYTNKEIMWGYRFKSCIHYSREHQKYVVDHNKFGELVECDTPLCSAQTLSCLLEDITVTKQSNTIDNKSTS